MSAELCCFRIHASPYSLKITLCIKLNLEFDVRIYHLIIENVLLNTKAF